MKLSAKLRITSISNAGPATVAAHDAERLCERSFDQRDTIGDPLLLGNAATARAVKTDRMDFIEIGDGAVLLRDVTDRGDRRHVAIHAVDAFERDDHGAFRRDRRHQLVEVGGIVVPEDESLRPGTADTLDHRIVVERVGEDRTVRQ